MKEIRFKTEEHKHIYKLFLEGYNNSEIAEEVGYSPSAIGKIRRSMIDKGLLPEPATIKSRETEMMLRKFLTDKWHWKKVNPPKKKDSKYRTVKKGERGHLRTPYRPDGIFK